ncbi:hypothetical protein A3J98_00615 [candidate division WS6 bacterium RIFOXYC1_FULL_33_10]|uniref:histidine kinase n=2 Tax=Candidatus Dojkabacteria TaxID=74243 RepID=A0A1F4UFR9_9BACT|nr:MAG: hypothetical protein A2400_02740 [candidate division WS6 bacterium RIFOXYB1_FULL_33_14]OGC45668.1 MAG: hypothetical protein A3J98_00615 [candidate division WS6 bacterium RIFOXYC1_FULL_33_10]
MYIYILYVLQILGHLGLLSLLFPKLKENKSLAGLIVFNLSIIAWIVISWLIIENYNKEYVIWFVRSSYLVTSIALSSFVVFVRSNLKKKFDWVSLLVIILSFITSALSFTNLIVKDVILNESTKLVPVIFGNLSFLFIIYFLFGVVILVLSVVKNKENIKGIESLRLRYVTLGMVLGGVTALITNVVIPQLTGKSDSALLGPMAISIVSVITTYSYIRNRLFGIKFLIRRFIYYSLLVILPLFFFYFTILLQNTLFDDFFGRDSFSLVFFISILFAPSYLWIRDKIRDNSYSILKDKKIDPITTKDNFLREISTKLDINELGIYTINTVTKYLDIKKAGIIIFKKDNASVFYTALRQIDNKKFSVRDLLQVIYHWDKVGHSTVLVRDEIESKKGTDKRIERILFFMKQNDIHVILPLNRKVQLNGVVLLGIKEDKTPYTVEDIHFLESIIINASMAFGRAILYQEVEDFNKVLQNKVDIQTKELKLKVKELEEARRKENDMIDIMGHELRTPATVIKLNIDFLHQFTNKLPTDRESFLKYITRIKDAVETEIKLINTLLTSAKLAGDKVEINPEKVDVFKEIDMALHAEEALAKEKGLKLVNNVKEGTYFIYADHARVSEIFNNLISNAVRYTQKGSIQVDSKQEGNFVKVMIKDTGRGISKSDITNLGKKFYRTKTYIESSKGDNINIVRPGGTGLGLYVTFGLTRKMGGRVDVQSEVGKGSTFSISLPKYTNQSQSSDTDSKDMFTRLNLKKGK